jgi:hypothetical protein
LQVRFAQHAFLQSAARCCHAHKFGIALFQKFMFFAI